MPFGGFQRQHNPRQYDSQTYGRGRLSSNLQHVKSVESKILETHRLRSVLNAQDDDALRQADNKLLTSMKALAKRGSSSKVDDVSVRIEAKQRLENFDILKPSKFKAPPDLNMTDRQALQRSLTELEGDSDLMESHPASALMDQASEIVSEDNLKQKNKKEVLYVEKPNSKKLTVPSLSSAHKKQLVRVLLDSIRSTLEVDSNTLMKPSTKSKLRSLQIWLVTFFPNTLSEVSAVVDKVKTQLGPILNEQYSVEDSKDLMQKLSISNVLRESLDSIFIDSDKGKINMPKALKTIRTIGLNRQTQ